MPKMEWVDNLNGLRCPTCSEVLLSHAARHDVINRPDPVYLHGGTRACPNGHDLPSEAVLYAWRDENGFKPSE